MIQKKGWFIFGKLKIRMWSISCLERRSLNCGVLCYEIQRTRASLTQASYLYLYTLTTLHTILKWHSNEEALYDHIIGTKYDTLCVITFELPWLNGYHDVIGRFYLNYISIKQYEEQCEQVIFRLSWSHKHLKSILVDVTILNGLLKGI